MESNLLSISKIFTERLLRIPDYQRGYAWTPKEVSEFWNDLIHLEDGKNHYVGVLTLEDAPQKNIENWVEDHWIIKARNYAPYFVVDGQQRLTTIIILIQTIIEEINLRNEKIQDKLQLNYTDIVDIRKKFIFETKATSASRSYIFGYDKDNPSYEYLKREIFCEMSEKSGALEDTIYTQNLSSAKVYFSKNLKTLTIPQIQTIYTKITQNFLFNIYSLDAEIDTYVAFETMNNRGKTLSHLELLKNRLIYLTTKLDQEDYEKASLRHDINECWKSMYHFLGKDISRRLDDDEFLYHHYILYFKSFPKPTDAELIPGMENLPTRVLIPGVGRNEHKKVLIDDIFSAKPLNDKSRTHQVTAVFIKDYVSSLKQSVETWYKIHNPEESNYHVDIRKWLSRINKIPSWVSTRVLLLEALNNKFTIAKTATFLQHIEKCLFISTLLLDAYFHRNFNFNNYALQLKGSKDIEKTTAILKSELDKMQKYIVPHFYNTFNRDCDFYNWKGIRYFMYEYELSIRTNSKSERIKLDWEEFNKNENILDYKTIEHIYPQNTRSHDWTSKFSRYTVRERKKFRHALGNLVPISSKKNSSLSNRPFSEKVARGFRYGCYSENELTVCDDWGPEEIKERSVKLLMFMDQRWELGLCSANILKDKAKTRTHLLLLIGLNI